MQILLFMRLKHLASMVKRPVSSGLPDNEALSHSPAVGRVGGRKRREIPTVSDTIRALSSIPELALFLICERPGQPEHVLLPSSLSSFPGIGQCYGISLLTAAILTSSDGHRSST